MPRSLNRSLNRRLHRSATRMLNGARRNRLHHFRQGIRALRRSIRAHLRLMKLAPAFFDPEFIRRETKVREEQQKWEAEIDAVLDKIYGPSSADQPMNSSGNSPSMALPRSTRAAIGRELAGCESWQRLGLDLLKIHRQRYPHLQLGLSHVADLIEVAMKLGWLAAGLPFNPPPTPDPPAPSRDEFYAALERAYGRPAKPVPDLRPPRSDLRPPSPRFDAQLTYSTGRIASS